MCKEGTRIRFTFCVAIYCALLSLTYFAHAQTSQPKTLDESLRVFAVPSVMQDSPDFTKLRSALRGQTDVPIKLPTFLPYIGAANPIAASLVSTSSSSYEISLGWGQDCFSADLREGAGACHYGTIRGSSVVLSENSGRRIPVILLGGTHGYFVPFTCGAHCDDAAVGWEEGGYHYSISLKAGSKKELVKVANSAIAQQHDKSLARK